MMRPFPLILFILATATTGTFGDILLNVQTQRQKVIDVGESFNLDLQDYFQLYAEPGPIATLTYSFPVQTGFADLQYKTTEDAQGKQIPLYEENGETLEFMTYELSGGSSYTHLYDPITAPANFVRQEYTVEFQLLAELAPIAVGNFIQYANDDEYDNTVVHRSDIGVVQMGLYRLSEKEEFLFKQIDKRGSIEFEETIVNAQGTLGMARATSFNSATSEFYINLRDNTEFLGTFFSVFGELINFETSMPMLEQMGDAYVYDLSNYFGSVLSTIPMFTPFWMEKENYLTFTNITVPEGTRTGVTYSWEFVDSDGVEGTSEEEAAVQAAFDIQLTDNQLVISRTDTAQVSVEVTGTSGDQERSFTIFLTGFNVDALDAFPASSIELGGFLDNIWYGLIRAETYPSIVHEFHGNQWVHNVTNEDGNNVGEFYIYDYKLNSWIYTASFLYPYMYIYGWDTWAWYVEETGNGADEPRWFYKFLPDDASEWVTD